MNMYNREFKTVFVDDPSGENEDIMKNTFKNVEIVANAQDAMLSIMTRRNCTMPILLLIDIDHHFCFLEKICQSIQYDHLMNIIPIECIQTGASDFILKPFREPVMKTMFLNVHRHQSRPVQRTIQDRLDYISKDHNWLSDNLHKQYILEPSMQKRQSIYDLSSIQIHLNSDRQAFLKEFVCDWNFSPLDLNDVELVHCVYIMLEQTFEQLTELNSLRMKKGKSKK
ncbi:hypothetical protein INT47_009192 [Mucor saturninus]|uniref:Uncharacterized protein n=1 Tax=Mucor saturninus TaxID=64648 RepID=A0A8H7VEH3_9FUNG|nr:hypothetical protein INT47_009192 [Mucor saturninus]